MDNRLVEAVVFDMDGTLLDSSRTVPEAYAAAIVDLCGRVCTAEEIISAYSAGPAGALIEVFTGRPSTPADVDCWHEHLEARLHLTTVYEGVADALKALRERGLRLAVFTGATRRAAHAQLAHSSLEDYIEVLVGSDEIEKVKPAPDGLVLAGRRLGVPTDRLAYVGDALNDLRCARAVGAVPVAAAWGHLFEPDDEPHLVAQSPTELVRLLADPAAGGGGERVLGLPGDVRVDKGDRSHAGGLSAAPSHDAFALPNTSDAPHSRADRRPPGHRFPTLPRMELCEVAIEQVANLRVRALRLPDPFIEEDFDEAACHLMCHDDGGTAIAAVSVMPQGCPEVQAQRPTRFWAMAVDPAHQRRGAGRHLFSELVRWSRRRGHDLLWANARVEVVEFYLSVGMTPRGAPFWRENTGRQHVIVTMAL